MIMDRIALIISIIGALNWGSIGLFRFDIVAWICGGSASVWARIVYTVVALAGIWCISLLFRTRETFEGLEEGDTTAGKQGRLCPYTTHPEKQPGDTALLLDGRGVPGLCSGQSPNITTSACP